MKTIPALTLIVTSIVATSLLPAADFTSGSTGSYGPLTLTSGTTTLALPADGIFHCTTITIPSGANLRFQRNALNTPVYLLATGDVVIGGTVDVSAEQPVSSIMGGAGGPGGFDGGASGFFSTSATRPAGDGKGPGGGKHGSTSTAGAGSFGSVSAVQAEVRLHGATYGNALLIPLIGGSGGGGVDGTSGGHGGGGGGAILIASSTKIVITGSISANGLYGGAANYNEGSGGGVRLVAPRVFGNGTIQARSYYSQANGRIRVDSLFKIDPLDNSQFLGLQFNPANGATVGANLIVFPPNNPQLDIIAAAGTPIAEGAGSTVAVVLPLDAPAAQTVVVQARDFNSSVPIRVALIPESGDTTFVDATIDNAAANPATATVNVTLPANVKIDVQVWSR